MLGAGIRGELSRLRASVRGHTTTLQDLLQLAEMSPEIMPWA
jgi:hypothetical protein